MAGLTLQPWLRRRRLERAFSLPSDSELCMVSLEGSVMKKQVYEVNAKSRVLGTVGGKHGEFLVLLLFKVQWLPQCELSVQWFVPFSGSCCSVVRAV